MGTIKALCLEAERHALADQQREPGAEHFLLAALDLADGSALRAFRRANSDPTRLKDAIARQYTAALESVGVGADVAAHADKSAPLPSAAGLYRAAPSAQEVIRRLAKRRTDGEGGPLTGAHVVAVVAGFEEGVSPRALRVLGVEPKALAAAAEAEIADGRATAASS